MGDNPIVVPDDVHKVIMKVRETGKTNMLDYHRVAKIASRMGYNKAALWILENVSDYSKGIFQGFKSVEGDERKKE